MGGPYGQRFAPGIPEIGNPRHAGEYLCDEANEVHGEGRRRCEDAVDTVPPYQAHRANRREDGPVLLFITQQNEQRSGVAPQSLTAALAAVRSTGRLDRRPIAA